MVFSIARAALIGSLSLAAMLLVEGRSLAVDFVGYVPYYRLSSNYLNNILPDQLSILDEVRYFGLSVNNSGGISSLSGSVNSHKDNIATIKGIIDSLPVDERPRLDITLGGAGVDSVFSTIAASSSLRATLAQNIADLLDETGATSVDIDWEHPDVGIERTTHYPDLLKRITLGEITMAQRARRGLSILVVPSSATTGIRTPIRVSNIERLRTV